VYSHPQALAQCAPFLKRHNIEPRAAYNTAGAARDLADTPEPGAAAIASLRAGRIHQLSILATDIQTRSDNTTRFFAIARERPAELVGEKASLVFSTVNQPGALLACLEAFANGSLNLTKLESRPTGHALWEYYFYVDIEAGDEPLTVAAIDEVVSDLHGRIDIVRVLGIYPRVK
jgi:prephenate dehydratase